MDDLNEVAAPWQQSLGLKNWDFIKNFKADVPNYLHVISFGELQGSPWRQSSGSTTGANNQNLIAT